MKSKSEVEENGNNLKKEEAFLVGAWYIKPTKGVDKVSVE